MTGTATIAAQWRSDVTDVLSRGVCEGLALRAEHQHSSSGREVNDRLSSMFDHLVPILATAPPAIGSPPDSGAHSPTRFLASAEEAIPVFEEIKS
jgi:hypothetical protein